MVYRKNEARQKSQLKSRAKNHAANLILERLDARMGLSGDLSPLDDYHGNMALIVSVLDEVFE